MLFNLEVFSQQVAALAEKSPEKMVDCLINRRIYDCDVADAAFALEDGKVISDADSVWDMTLKNFSELLQRL